jgi:hypothetical protein
MKTSGISPLPTSHFWEKLETRNQKLEIAKALPGMKVFSTGSQEICNLVGWYWWGLNLSCPVE